MFFFETRCISYNIVKGPLCRWKGRVTPRKGWVEGPQRWTYWRITTKRSSENWGKLMPFGGGGKGAHSGLRRHWARWSVALFVCSVRQFAPYRWQFIASLHRTSHTGLQQSGEDLVRFSSREVKGQGQAATTSIEILCTRQILNCWRALNHNLHEYLLYLIDDVLEVIGSKVKVDFA